MKTISIGKDFSPTPIGRYPNDSDYSGELFRNEHLLPALNQNDCVEIIIDDAEGYGSSFLEEAFGGLIRHGHYSPSQLESKLKISCSRPAYKIYELLIWKYIHNASKK